MSGTRYLLPYLQTVLTVCTIQYLPTHSCLEAVVGTVLEPSTLA